MPLSTRARLGSYEIGSPSAPAARAKSIAHAIPNSRDVALKILPAVLASDADRMAHFEREARVLASLDHPNIAAIYGLEDSDGVRALVMALIDGPTPAERINAGPIPLDEAILIARQIAEALECAHDRAIIHRDLTPADIKIALGGSVKVLDFGLATALDDEPANPSTPELTHAHYERHSAGVLFGTAAYMSPERSPFPLTPPVLHKGKF